MTDETQANAKAKAEAETVAMDDGRLVDFAGKRRLLKSSFIENGEVKVRMDFRNGETRLFTLPQELLLAAAAHGCEQKLGDETAGLGDIDDMILAVDKLMDRLTQEKKWNSVREGGSALAGTSILLKALVEHYGKPVEVVKAFLADKTQAEKLALRNSTKIRPIIERLEAEKASKGSKVDTDALLAGLDAA